MAEGAAGKMGGGYICYNRSIVTQGVLKRSGKPGKDGVCPIVGSHRFVSDGGIKTPSIVFRHTGIFATLVSVLLVTPGLLSFTQQ